MIVLTKLNGEKFMVNQDLIEFVDRTPDTVISMTSGKKIPVAESMETVQSEVIKFKQKVYCRPHPSMDSF
ncbi:MAG: flagellar FlbD family protein [Eubacteriales bacterium]|nr:flagellar FlbD family protein [Eubacteriales bacterium]